MDVNCTGTANCFLDSSAAGVLSTSNNSFQPAYAAGSGWDFATGIGTLNAANLVNNWPGGKPNFTLSTAASTLGFAQGSSGSTDVVITPWNGFNSAVNLSASGLPSGVTAAFSPNPATTNTSTLTLTASNSAALGTSTITVTGTSGSLTSVTTLSLTVSIRGSYTLSASPSSLIVARGATGSSVITVIPQDGFSGSVSLTASDLPSGVTASFDPSSATGTSTLRFAASSVAAVGTVDVSVTGTSSGLSSTTLISLSVAAPVNPNLPSGWSDLDVGADGLPGGAGYANGVFTVTASGQWIWSNADGMHFVYQSLSGDGT